MRSNNTKKRPTDREKVGLFCYSLYSIQKIHVADNGGASKRRYYCSSFNKEELARSV